MFGKKTEWEERVVRDSCLCFLAGTTVTRGEMRRPWEAGSLEPSALLVNPGCRSAPQGCPAPGPSSSPLCSSAPCGGSRPELGGRHLRPPPSGTWGEPPTNQRGGYPREGGNPRGLKDRVGMAEGGWGGQRRQRASGRELPWGPVRPPPRALGQSGDVSRPGPWEDRKAGTASWGKSGGTRAS